MRVLIIPDVHGRTLWKEHVKEEHDLCVFLGDYFDSWDETAASQIANFREIMEYKKANKDKTKCLIGNHDHHYIRGCNGGTSGYQKVHAVDIQLVMEEFMDELQAAYILRHETSNILFTHAGVSKSFLKLPYIAIDENSPTLDEDLNMLMKHKPTCFMFNGRESHGDDVYQTPIWIRPKSLIADKIDGYVQVVGHTQMKEISVQDGVIFTDVHGFNTEPIIISL